MFSFSWVCHTKAVSKHYFNLEDVHLSANPPSTDLSGYYCSFATNSLTRFSSTMYK